MEDRARSPRRQRYEAKYIISESQAAEVRRYCLAHLPPDPYAVGQPGGEYPILSVYLDSPTGELLRSTIQRSVRRYKLRVRSYRRYNEPASDLPAFFEIKRKSNGVINKTRARMPVTLAESVLREESAQLDLREGHNGASDATAQEFLMLRTAIGAKPVVGVFYTREAYEERSANRIRVTLDRNLHYGLLAPANNGFRDVWCPALEGVVILEVKFDNTYPFWVADMLRRVEVLRRGVCKYLLCSRAAGTLQFAMSR